MEVRLTPEQEELITRAIETGRVRSAADAVEEALLLWEDRERRRREILEVVDEADASLGRGEGRAITERDMRQLSSEVKAAGRARLGPDTPRSG
jgi:Arc/MetJ-type ribon-helix-helix transcriptional regulator